MSFQLNFVILHKIHLITQTQNKSIYCNSIEFSQARINITKHIKISTKKFSKNACYIASDSGDFTRKMGCKMQCCSINNLFGSIISIDS